MRLTKKIPREESNNLSNSEEEEITQRSQVGHWFILTSKNNSVERAYCWLEDVKKKKEGKDATLSRIHHSIGNVKKTRQNRIIYRYIFKPMFRRADNEGSYLWHRLIALEQKCYQSCQLYRNGFQAKYLAARQFVRQNGTNPTEDANLIYDTTTPGIDLIFVAKSYTGCFVSRFVTSQSHDRSPFAKSWFIQYLLYGLSTSKQYSVLGVK